MIIDILTSGFRLSKTRDKQLVHGILWTIVEGFFAALPFVFLFMMLTQAFAKELTIKAAIFFGGGMVLSFLLRIGASAIGAPKIYNGAFTMMGEARLNVAEHLRKLPMGWFNKQRSGDLAGRLTSDITFVEHMWSHFIQPFVAGFSMPVFLTIFLFFVDFRLAIVMLCGFPLTLLALLWTLAMGKSAGVKLGKANSAVQSALLEYVQSITVIRSFGRFGNSWKRLVKILDDQRNAWFHAETRTSPFLSCFGFVLEMSYISLVIFGIYWLANDKLTVPQLLIFLIIALPAYRQLYEVGQAMLMLRLANRSLMRIEALLHEPTLTEPQHPEMPENYEIRFDHVGFSYDKKEENNKDETGNKKAMGNKVLDDISCVIRPQELTAIVGPSGARKTSFVHLIARLWERTEGKITIGNIDLKDIGTENLHRLIGMVFQDVLLFSGTVYDNIKIGKEDASPEEIIEAAKQAEAHQFIMALPEGYDTVLDEHGSSLSGGEQQRISIARAFLKNAPILLLDEATASLDPSAEAEIQRAMNALTRTRTVVVIAHRLNSIRRADHIIVLKNGKIVEEGTHDRLVKADGLYQKLWNNQNKARGVFPPTEAIPN